VAIYAIVKNKKVINTVIWDGKSDWSTNKGQLIKINDSDEPEPGLPGIDWDYIDGKFIDNRPKDFIDWYNGETEGES